MMFVKPTKEIVIDRMMINAGCHATLDRIFNFAEDLGIFKA